MAPTSLIVDAAFKMLNEPVATPQVQPEDLALEVRALVRELNAKLNLCKQAGMLVFMSAESAGASVNLHRESRFRVTAIKQVKEF